MNNSVCYFKNYFLDNLALNKNCIWPLMTCIAASRTLRSSCGICWRAFTRMWIRWQVNLSLSPSRMRISASMNASFSQSYLNMFMTTLIKALCLTCLMNYLNLQNTEAVITYVLKHVHIYFCGFNLYFWYICTCQYLKCSTMKSVFQTTTVLSEVYIVYHFISSDQDKAKEYWRVYLTYDNSHIVG